MQYSTLSLIRPVKACLPLLLPCWYSSSKSCLEAWHAAGGPSLRLLVKSSCSAEVCSRAEQTALGWALAKASRKGRHCARKASPALQENKGLCH